MKHYIIDGNNLIGKIKSLKSLQNNIKQASREKLANLLERYFINKKAKITLHLDGFAGESINVSKMKIIYSENITADEKIKKQIEEIQSRRNLIVITSDNNLIEFARVCGCEVRKSETFVKQLTVPENQDEEKLRIESIDDPEVFKKLFGV